MQVTRHQKYCRLQDRFTGKSKEKTWWAIFGKIGLFVPGSRVPCSLLKAEASASMKTATREEKVTAGVRWSRSPHFLNFHFENSQWLLSVEARAVTLLQLQCHLFHWGQLTAISSLLPGHPQCCKKSPSVQCTHHEGQGRPGLQPTASKASLTSGMSLDARQTAFQATASHHLAERWCPPPLNLVPLRVSRVQVRGYVGSADSTGQARQDSTRFLGSPNNQVTVI